MTVLEQVLAAAVFTQGEFGGCALWYRPRGNTHMGSDMVMSRLWCPCATGQGIKSPSAFRPCPWAP